MMRVGGVPTDRGVLLAVMQQKKEERGQPVVAPVYRGY